MKRAIAFVCIVFLLLFSSAVIAEENNLLSNGGFEKISSSGGPADWYLSAYRTQAGYSRIAVTEEKAHSGRYSAVIENASANDARYTCTVKVNPESLYRLSGYVLVESMEDTGNGANFAVEGIYSFSDGLFDTDGDWQYLEWYGETGENQTEVTVGVRVGGYSAESTGKAYFDDIVLEEVDTLPDEVIASLWYNAYAGVQGQQEETEEGSSKSTAWFVVLGFAFLLVFVLLMPNMNHRNDSRFTAIMFVILCILAFLLRIVVSMSVEGYEVDINCFRAWSMRMASVGPLGFYAPDYFCDYPPGAMLLLWPVGLLLSTVGLNNEGLTLLILKFLPILADLLGAVVLFRYASKRLTSSHAIAVSLLYLFNPAVLVNGAAWGQVDSVLTLFLLLTTLSAMEKKWRMAIPLFFVSALVKPQALLFAPIGAIAWICHLSDTQKADRKAVLIQSAIGLCIGFGSAVAIVVPFAARQINPWTWVFELYAETLRSYAYVTLNTANLYYLFGANWTSLTQTAPALLLSLMTAVFAGMGCALCVRQTAGLLCINASKRKTLAVLMLAMSAAMLFMLILGVSYGAFGLAMMAFAYLLPIVCFCGDRRRGSLPYWMSLALICIYVLGIKVHERYLFPALMLMLLAYVDTRDRRILAVFAGFSVTTFINTAVVLDNSILFGAAQGHLNPDTLVLNNLLCILNLLLCGFAIYVGMNGIRESKGVDDAFHKGIRIEGNRTASYQQLLLAPRDHRLHLSVRDYLIMGIVTIAYAILAFTNLGSTAAPQTAWVSTADDENVVLELDESSTFSVLYYAGVSYNDFAISVSEDGVNWSQSYPCEMRQGLCYRWNYALKTNASDDTVSYLDAKPSNVLWMTGKYLRVEAVDAGLNLWEIVARDQNGSNLPLKLAAHNNAQPQMLSESKPASNLIDEQNTCVGEPGWYNGTYFDEIYHARTAYEHLHGLAPYETTHPPLGKLMMSAAIAVFGMTPFGWRFAGALIGVLMLPALYLLGMQLTHKRSVAAVSMMAFALDLMHFTQTRIATIDSFPVFFILLTYLFMIRYLQMDSFAVPNSEAPRLMDRAYLKTLVPLLLCGICMGLSIASKWIGIYSAVGLAILFFAAMYRNIRIWQTAWDTEIDDQNPRVQAVRLFTIHRIAITCAFCVLFFVLIPCLIYAASYIPYLSPTGPVTLKRIIKAQEGMLSYHSTPGLGMDHPFQSPWWQWPFILKPIWFAQDKFEPAGYASTILCFGNPWVFYIGAIAMAFVLMASIGRTIRLRNRRLVLVHGNGDWTLAMLSVAFLAQYLPWVLVPRSMYMYHYFASVPFIILATALLIERFTGRKPAVRTVVMAVYIAGAAVFFIMFFPYASGYLTSTIWLDAMKWFSKLYY